MGKTFTLIASCWLMAACATLNPDYEKPTVIITSFHALPSENAIPAFEIGLRIINPNPAPINLDGIVYSVSLQGYELVKGVGKGYPQIEGYSEGDITLSASANLLEGIRFLANMVQNQERALQYEFEAKLDVGGIFPSLKVSQAGTFDLDNPLQQ